MTGRNYLSPHQFKYDVDIDESTGLINATHPKTGVHVGHFWWNTDDNEPHEILHVYTKRGFTRRGIATHMLNMARDYDPSIQHSNVRSEKGDKWAGSTDIPAPANEGYRAKGKAA